MSTIKVHLFVKATILTIYAINVESLYPMVLIHTCDYFRSQCVAEYALGYAHNTMVTDVGGNVYR